MIVKKNYRNLQMRYSGEHVCTGLEVPFRGKCYTLGTTEQQTLGSKVPIGVLINGYTKQFELLADGECIGSAWFYFYCSFEGRLWGILDELELTETPGKTA